jgi:hypothetical protein
MTYFPSGFSDLLEESVPVLCSCVAGPCVAVWLGTGVTISLLKQTLSFTFHTGTPTSKTVAVVTWCAAVHTEQKTTNSMMINDSS